MRRGRNEVLHELDVVLARGIEEDHIRVQLRTAIPGMQQVDGAEDIDSTALRQDQAQALPHDSHVAHDENAQLHRPAS